MNTEVRKTLIIQARLGRSLAYHTIMEPLGLNHTVEHDRAVIGEILGDISRFEHTKHRPMLSAMVMHANKKDFGPGFYKLAEELGHGDEYELKRNEFGTQMQELCHTFWVDEENYQKCVEDINEDGNIDSATIIIDFFKKDEIDFFSEWANKVYQKTSTEHIRAKNYLLDTVWDKTVFWSNELKKRLQDFEVQNDRNWQLRGWEKRGDESKSIVRFKPYTWARLFKTDQPTQDICFTVGLYPENRCLRYNLFCYSKQDSDLSLEQQSLCEQLMPYENNTIEISFENIPSYNWQKLLDETEIFIRGRLAKYEEVIKSVCNYSLNMNVLKDLLIKREIPENGYEEIPKRTFTFKEHEQDWQQKQKETTDLGERGEDLVIKYERNHLHAKGFHNYAKDVKKMPDGVGYDIFSKHEDGTEKYIEVKSTTGNENTPFFISLNELEFSKLHSKQYYLYRVYNLKKESGVGEFYEYYGNIENGFLLEGIQFNAYKKKIKS